MNTEGLITGLATGTANITATIGEVSDTVPVTVYEIQTNTEDETVPDTAGDIIDDIGNNETPDIFNTDIDPDDLDDIRDQIHEGMERGDEFRTDIMLSKRDWAHFKKYWDDIQAWLANGQFAGGYDIGVEVYHQDGNGQKYHIANITQFGNEIGFTIEADALPETAPGQLKDFKLIRIHDGVLEEIPVKMNKDGSFSAKSDKFSEFILVYKEVEEDSKAVLILPASLTTIGPEAFAGVSSEIVIIPPTVSDIAGNAFEGSKIETIIGSTEYVEQFAEVHNLNYQSA